MKKWLLILLIPVLSLNATAQSQEAQQLLLNWEKLAQFKKILNNMYKGYKILYKGYTSIKDLSAGNFSLHQRFLDALLAVSPGVKKYKRITDIIRYQRRIVNEYKAAFNQFKQDKNFTIDEIEYIGKVYNNLFKQGLNSLDELSMIITAGKLSMSDDERLQAIDRIYEDIVGQFSFLRDFNNSTTVLSLQRGKEKQDINLSRRLYSIKD